MSIEKSQGGFILICDVCFQESAEYFDSFEEAVDYKRDRHNGWRSTKDDCGDWSDLCPRCAKEELL